ncbi:KilA-N domain-containing protein [Novacetimonas maltaceti]|uniref:KilA-N domain-containing protein n=1 Tax=Novacetimonas maltaceti TaxID=1203393 RepID=A0A2S3W4P9_9PROT|nr:KilA-N domain-containing protein [Novacetimonas maltaceti]POF63846.1 hypothetical protein KMAL_03770 [Novacetimonas maltaceti]
MPAAKRAHTTTLSILNTTIRQDPFGRYCLNDCYKAAGSPSHKGPNEWTKNAQTDGLIEELRSGGNSPDPIKIIKTGPNEKRGTYVVKELVYAYAMWISPAFHLRVIRAFDAMMQGTALPPPVDAVAAHKQAAAIFRSLNHVGKLTGMSREDAARAANAAAKQHTGIDLLAELQGGLPVPVRPAGHAVPVIPEPDPHICRSQEELELLKEMRRLPADKREKMEIILKGALGGNVSKDRMWRTAVEAGCAQELHTFLDLLPSKPVH